MPEPLRLNDFNGNNIFNISGGAITGSTVNRWGVFAVQEIDSAAMHVFARWQHLELQLDHTGTVTNGSLSFDDQDIFQAGGVIFF